MNKKPKMLGLYFHIPFCVQKCNYCSFFSITQLNLIENFVKNLCKELINRCQHFNFKEYEVDSIYFGGGTPSLLSFEHFFKIFNTITKLFHVKHSTEITIEINPFKTNSYFYLKQLKNLGVNRLSVGVQSTSSSILKLLGRRHNFNDAKFLIFNSQKAGFLNISADLIIGVPGQTLENLNECLKKYFKLGLTHISIYMLKIEKGTYFYKNRPKFIPSNDETANFYEKTVEILKRNNFQQYEISNFAKFNFKSFHNLKYWTMKPYLGFGPSAHSYFNNKRYHNHCNVKEYISKKFNIIYEQTKMSKDKEWFLLRSRIVSTITFNELKKHGFNISKMLVKLKKLNNENLIKLTSKGFKITTKGLLLHNSLVLYLLE